MVRQTLEQRLQQMLGERDIAIADLLTKLETAQARIEELEKSGEIQAAKDRLPLPPNGKNPKNGLHTLT